MEYLTILEKRVQEMIELIKTLRNEKHALEIQLSEEEKSSEALRKERGEVRDRVEKVLAKLMAIEQGKNNSNNHSMTERETEQAPSY